MGSDHDHGLPEKLQNWGNHSSIVFFVITNIIHLFITFIVIHTVIVTPGFRITRPAWRKQVVGASPSVPLLPDPASGAVVESSFQETCQPGKCTLTLLDTRQTTRNNSEYIPEILNVAGNVGQTTKKTTTSPWIRMNVWLHHGACA